ncbi:hypothetical protein Tco_0187795 [Tanacetum coccineum]
MAIQKKAICWDTLLAAKNQKGKGPDWMFNLELLTPSMNYIPLKNFEKCQQYFNSTLNYMTSVNNTLTLHSDDDIPKDGVFSTNSFDDESTDNEEDGAPDYTNMDHTIDVSSTPTHRIHKNHPQSQIIGKSTAGVLTRKSIS